MSLGPADFWRGNTRLRDITPRGERFPETGLYPTLAAVCRGSVFEFGCGDGRLSPAFSADQYAGYDINPTALRAAAEANPRHRYVSEWEPADTWLAWTVLLHVPDDELPGLLQRVRELWIVLLPGIVRPERLEALRGLADLIAE